MENKLQITQDEINNIENFNLPLLKEAMRQVELKVNDEHVRKDRVDTRVYKLLTICLVLIALIFGVVNSNFLQKNITIYLSITGVMLSISVILLFFALKSKHYSSLGTMPHTWLIKDYIQSYNVDNKDSKVLGYVLSYVLYNYNNLLISSHKSNDIRIALLDLAILVLSLSFVPMLGAFFITIHSYFV